MPFPELKFEMRTDTDLLSVVMNQNEVSDEEEDELD